MGITSLLNGVLVASAPWLTNVYVQIIVQGLVGFTLGQIDSGINIQDILLHFLEHIYKSEYNR